MSRSRGCLAIEREPGKWFCVVAREEYDYDFRHGHDVFGPKPTAEAALEEMHSHESNPGGHSTIPLNEVTDHHHQLVDEGHRPQYMSLKGLSADQMMRLFRLG